MSSPWGSDTLGSSSAIAAFCFAKSSDGLLFWRRDMVRWKLIAGTNLIASVWEVIMNELAGLILNWEALLQLKISPPIYRGHLV